MSSKPKLEIGAKWIDYGKTTLAAALLNILNIETYPKKYNSAKQKRKKKTIK